MKRMLLILAWILSTFVSCTHRLTSDNQNLKCFVLKKRPSLYIPSELSEEYDYKIIDTLSKKIALVFEQSFNDSVLITLNDSIIYNLRIKTNHFYTAVGRNFFIDYHHFKDLPTIKILLIERHKCFEFKPFFGFRMMYVNLINDRWGAEVSNYPKMYY